MAIRFEPNPAGIREVGHLPGVVAEQKRIAREIITRARVVSPSHDFDETLEILDVRPTAQGMKVSVGTRWSFGHLIEWGSVNNRPYAPLRKAITGLHLRFKPAGRR